MGSLRTTLGVSGRLGHLARWTRGRPGRRCTPGTLDMGTPGACFLNFRAYPSSRGNWPWLSENVSFFEHRKRPQFLRHWYRNMKLATLRSPRLAILLPHLLFTCASARAPRYANLFEARQRPERSCRASASNSRTHAETAPLPQAALPHFSQLWGRAPL